LIVAGNITVSYPGFFSKLLSESYTPALSTALQVVYLMSIYNKTLFKDGYYNVIW